MMSTAALTALITRLTRDAQPFALATVVRSRAATAARAGAKAVILPDGSLGAGWIGGGCVQGAALRAARAALSEGKPRLISIQPEEALAALAVHPGEERDGIHFARNGCASRGSVDIFIEPVLPAPRLCLFGASPVAETLARLAPECGFTVIRDTAEGSETPQQGQATAGFAVVATQGRGDAAALKAALGLGASYTAFVGSQQKVESLKAALLAEGHPPGPLSRLHGPAGLPIGAATPEEIALSILAEMVRARRCPAPQRKDDVEGGADD
ncbi:XdhC family protein [Acidisoma sp. C75]